MIVNSSTLPTKPSDLLELAVQSALSLDPSEYTPDALYYHHPRPLDGTCHVCLAGGVIASFDKVPKTARVTPYTLSDLADISYQDVASLLAIDHARGGNWPQMFKALRIDQEYYPDLPYLIQDLNAQSDTHPHRLFQGWDHLRDHTDHIMTCVKILRSYNL